MKKIIIFFTFLIYFISFSQNEKQVELYNYQYQNSPGYHNQRINLIVNNGKPVFIVVNIEHSNPNDSLIAVREINELKENFKDKDAIFITKFNNGKVIFKNNSKQEFDYVEYNDAHKKFLFWNGKKDSDVIVNDNIVENTEFVANIFESDKKSKYIDRFYKEKDSIDKLINENIENPIHKKLSEKFVNAMLFEQIFYLKYWRQFFEINFKGVKTLKVNSNKENYKNPWHELEFNKEGNPTSILFQTDDSDKKKSKINFIYEDSLLKKIAIEYKRKNNELVERENLLSYSNGHIYKNASFSGKLLSIYFLQNNFLLEKSIYFNDNTYEIEIEGETLSDDKIEYRDKGDLNSYQIKFTNGKDFFPLKQSFIDLENPNRTQFYETTKKSELIYEVNSEEGLRFVIEYLNKDLIKRITIKQNTKKEFLKKNDFILDFNYEFY